MYILFTSGSTNKAKAVKGTHVGLLNRLNWMYKTFPFNNNNNKKNNKKERILQKTSISFVDSITETCRKLNWSSDFNQPDIWNTASTNIIKLQPKIDGDDSSQPSIILRDCVF